MHVCITGPTSDIFVSDEKTILIVGSSGSGKTTLVDGLLNYISGVNFEDKFRFSMIELEEMRKKEVISLPDIEIETMKRLCKQALSQTEWITVYTIGPLEGGRVPFRLNIIDTPGFGDTRGIEQDNKIMEHIRELFLAKAPCGVDTIDAVCFIVKAPDARLTPIQTYIFSSILSIFEHDIGPNICALITFADGKDPIVLQSLRKADVPFGGWFPFNNSALFAENLNLAESSFTPMFWQMGMRSFDRFFDHIIHLKPKSWKLTQDVLQKRKNLQDLLYDIHPKINESLLKIDQLKREVDIFKENEETIKASKNFKYEAEESTIITERLPPGTHVTNCIQCNTTCHSNCGIPDDDDKRRCCAMDSNGYCTICSKKCLWSRHRNHPYKYVVVVEKVQKNYEDVKKKFEMACKKKLTVEEVIQKLGNEVVEQFEHTNEMMKRMKDIKNKLQEIVLRPDPLSAVDHIDLMIRAEEMEKKYGFERRIEVLKKFKEFACTEDKFDELRASMQSFKDDINKVGEKKIIHRKVISGRDKFSKFTENAKFI
ncbi:uncharacterized protein LOC133194976 [Saccostrea echinata]|uniref:uncharacterized protein LOC133194976 n=1 Tax=Saccostrea echinata TaxID=191078 RepID=UPI002A815788|nr:uncharacterized protein LOC133194976 [Saccostrea echinata]